MATQHYEPLRMTAAQRATIDRLCRTHYDPSAWSKNTDGSVRVTIAKRLDAGRMQVNVTPDGRIRAVGVRDNSQPHTR